MVTPFASEDDVTLTMVVGDLVHGPGTMRAVQSGTPGSTSQDLGRFTGQAVFEWMSGRAGDLVLAPLQKAAGAVAAGAKRMWKKIRPPRKIIPEKRARHIFRESDGHLKDTPDNRRTLEDLANDSKSRLGTDARGNEWNARIEKDGSQTWTQSRGGEIINGGSNATPRPYNPETGLSAPSNR